MPFARAVPDTWEGVHAFVVFDHHVDYAADAPFHQHAWDFVWGAGRVVEPRRGRSRDALLAGYLPAHRDPRGRTPSFDERNHTLAWYEKNHPSWVVYRCPNGVAPTDRAHAEPAYYFDADGAHLVPLDVANPEVVAWQVATYGAHASRAIPRDAYDALGVDNLYLTNLHGFCGVFEGARFVRRYDPSDPHDPRYCRDVARWAASLAAGLHAHDPPVRLVGNVAPIDAVEPSCRSAVVASLDGVLDEGGFLRPDLKTPLDEQAFVRRLDFMREVQAGGRAYYLLAEHAIPPDPKAVCAPVVPKPARTFALAAYLLAKERSASLAITGLQQYGCPLWYPELDANVGHPCGPMRREAGAWVRESSRGVAVVNASAVPVAVPIERSEALRDLEGGAVAATLALAPHEAAVLVVAEGAPARCP